MMKLPKIGFLTDNYPLSGGSGGIGTYTQLVGEHLASLGHEVHIFTYAGGTRHCCRKVNGVVLWECPVWSKRREMPFDKALEFTFRHRNDALMLNRYSLSIAVRRALKGGVFDLLESPEIGALGGLVCSRKFTRKFAVRLHKPAGIEHESQGLPPIDARIKAAESSLALRADVLTAPTAAARSDIAKFWQVPLDNAIIVGNPVKKAEWRPDKKTKDSVEAVFFGRLEQRKGIDTLAAAIGLIRLNHPEFRVKFIGTDTQWLGEIRQKKGSDKIKDIADATGGVGGYTLVPPMPHHELKSSVQGATLCVLPSRSETFGMTFLEAMMWGVPCVVSDIAPFREIAEDQKHCLFADPESSEDLAKKVCVMLANPAMADRIADRAYQHAQNWSLQEVARQLVEAWSTQSEEFDFIK